MAKKGSVRKGFAGYLMILFIAILAAFLILLTILMFSPFKPILGFKYFVYNYDEKYQETTDDTNKKIPFNDIQDININCNAADVVIRREYNIDESTIKIENRSIGFARGDQDTSFTYEITYDLNNSRALNVTMHEPEGFLFIKKDITISLLVPTCRENEVDKDFTKTNINIITTKGDVFIGNQSKLTNEAGIEHFISCKRLDIKTTKGDVIVNPYVKKIEDLFIKTSRGDISVLNSIDVNNLQIYCPEGDIDLKNVKTQNATMELGNSYFDAETFEATGVAQFTIDKGDFHIENMKGSLTSNDMLGNLSKAKIRIDNVSGQLSIPNATGAKITINKIEDNSQVRIEGTKSSVKIGDVLGASKVWVILTSGSANVHTHSQNIDILTTSGTITLNYDCDQANDKLSVKSTSGTINFSTKETLRYRLNVLDANGNQRNQKNVKIQGQGSDFTLPWGDENATLMNLYTNGKVNVTYHE